MFQVFPTGVWRTMGEGNRRASRTREGEPVLGT